MMKVTEIPIQSDDICISVSHIAHLVGIDGNLIPEPFDRIILNELNHIIDNSEVSGGFYVSENVQLFPDKGAFECEGVRFHAGRRIVNFLKNSEYLAFFICSIGENVSHRAKQLKEHRDHLTSYISDTIGSVLVDRAMDQVHIKLKGHMNANGLKITNRYSPGYWSWNIEDQKRLFSFFPSGFCGVSLTENCLMIPEKSVSGVIGIGKKVTFRKYDCRECNSLHCIYRDKNIQSGSLFTCN